MMARMKEQYGVMKMFELCEFSTSKCAKCKRNFPNSVFNFFEKCATCRRTAYEVSVFGSNSIAIGMSAVATNIQSIAIGNSIILARPDA